MPEREKIHARGPAASRRAAEADREPAARTRPLQVRRLLHRRDRRRRSTRSSWRTTPGRCGTFPATSSRRRWSGPIGSTTRTRRTRREKPAARGLRGYDPLKFEDHTLGKGIAFQVYPEARLERGLGRDGRAGRPSSATASSASATSTSSRTCCSPSGDKHYFADYHTVFCSIDIDELWGENTLPYTGRMMIPLLIPGLAQRVSRRRRVAALLVVRVPDAGDRDEGHHAARQPGHADSDRGAGSAGRRRSASRGTRSTTRSSNNLFAEKAYPQQSEQAFATYHALCGPREEDPEPALRRPSRRIQVLGHAGDGQLRLSEGAGLPGGVMPVRVLDVDDVAQARAAAADAGGVRAPRPARPRSEPASLHRRRRAGRGGRRRRRRARPCACRWCRAAGATSFIDAPQIDDDRSRRSRGRSTIAHRARRLARCGCFSAGSRATSYGPASAST